MADHRPPPDWDDQLREVAGRARATAIARARDAAAVSIGLGLLGVNRAQALRRDLVARISTEPGSAGQRDR